MTFRLSTAAAGLALVLTAAAAQAQQTTPAEPNRRPSPEMQGGRGTRGGPERMLLRGVTLTPEQQQRVRAINEKYQAEGRPLREALRPAMQDARSARQRGDSAAARKAWERTAEQRRGLTALQERRVTEVRSVLTAEQQKQFDANRTAMQSRMQERRDQGGAPRPDGAGRRWRGRAG
jgi:Spy/CpxP family protein refolding chaperone